MVNILIRPIKITLLILVILYLIGFICNAIFIDFFQNRSTCQRDYQMIGVRVVTLLHLCDIYKKKHGAYPKFKTIEDMVSYFYEHDYGLANKKDEYIFDAWGSKMMLIYSQNTNEIIIVSAGVDKQFSTSDDKQWSSVMFKIKR